MLKRFLAAQCIIVTLFVLLIHLQLAGELSSQMVLTTLYLGLITLLSVNVFFFRLVDKIIQQREDEAVLELEKFYLNTTEQLEESLRATHHDFINHLQVIYSFLQLKKVDRACEYINQAREKIYQVRQKKKCDLMEI